MTLRIQNRTRAVFVWVAIIPILLAILTLWTRARLEATVALVNHARQVLLDVEDVQEMTTAAETAQRGYLLTSREQYEAPFQSAQSRVRGKLAELSQLVAGEPVQVRNVAVLQAATDAKFQELRDTIALQKKGQHESALAIVASDRGLHLMQQIAEICSRMSEEERSMLAGNTDRTKSLERAVDISLLAFIASSMFLLIWSSRLIDEYAAERELALAEVRAMNQRLEQRVSERTIELEEANENLKRSNADLEQFAYVASHDLQEPLRMVASYVGLLKRKYAGQLDGEADDYIQFAVSGAMRMRSLIDDLLTYSRVGTQQLNRAPASMDEILNEAIANLKTSIEESQAEILRSPLPTLRVDRVKMVQVFQNLLANTVKFRSPERRLQVRIESEVSKGEATVRISDNGMGFSPAFSERIFVLFQRLHNTSDYPGTGMGLAICKRIIEAHGGKIWACGEPGQGATFAFTLPNDQ